MNQLAGDTAMPLAQAATMLGTTPDALRMRFRRGRIKGYRDHGRLFVFLSAAEINKQKTTPGSESDAKLVALLEDQIADLRRRLDTAEQGQAELRRLLLLANNALADLTQKIAALPAPAPAAAPVSEARHASPAPSREEKPPAWRVHLDRMRRQSDET